MINDLITVCVTTYNRKGLIKNTIESIISQTYDNLEIIIIDDCSNDGTGEYIQNNILDLDNRIDYYRHDINKGLSAARNTAIRYSKGKYFTWVDDDDELEPESIQKRLEIMVFERENYPLLAVVYSGCSIQDKDLNRTFFNRPKINGIISKNIKNGILSTIPSSGLYVKELIVGIDGFDENLKSFIDHDFWLSMSQANYYAIGVDEPLTNVFIHRYKKSMVTNVSNRIDGIELFINKWQSYFECLMGKEDSEIFINNYRKIVIGNLTSLTIVYGERNDVIKLMKYLRLNVGFLKSTFYVLGLSVKQFLRPIYYLFKIKLS